MNDIRMREQFFYSTKLREAHLGAVVWAPSFGRRRLCARQLGAVPFGRGHLGAVSSYKEKTIKQVIP